MDKNNLINRIVIVGAAIAAFLLVLTIVLLVMPDDPSPEADPPETEETMTPNPWGAEGFYMQDGFLHYTDAPYQIGIDVSTHQGLIDWQAVADAGVEFAIIRAGYRGSTEGLLYEDEQFRYNLERAKAVGLQVGVYFFSQAVNTEEALEEAEFLCELLDGEVLDLPVFYDWEETGSDSRTGAYHSFPLTDFARTFCRAVTENGYAAGVYFNQNFGYHYFDLRELKAYTLWLAEYNIPPTFSYAFDCLQYTDSGTVAGIEVPVDLNLLFLPDEQPSP